MPSDLRVSVRGILTSPRDAAGLTFLELEPVRRRELELELEGNANCISSWSWYAGMMKKRVGIPGITQELVPEHEELELELQRNGTCISIWIWCASEELFRAGAGMLA